jgi:formylglycine-generating enzyme required for sulfatase activity
MIEKQLITTNRFVLVFVLASLCSSVALANNYVLELAYQAGLKNLEAKPAHELLDTTGFGLVPWNYTGTKPEAGQLVLRRKFNNQKYGYYASAPSATAFENMHVFDIASSDLSIEDIMGHRGYANRRMKAFQDEKDLYFDSKYVYSTRVRELHVFVRGAWYKFTAQKPNNGGFILRSEPTGATVMLDGLVAGTTPFYSAGYKAGTVNVTLSGKGLQRQSLHLTILAGKQFEKTVPMNPGSSVTYSLQYPVADSTINQAATVDSLWVLKNKLNAEVLALQQYQQKVIAEWETGYPTMDKAAVGVDEWSDPAYLAYKEKYLATKEQGKQELVAPLVPIGNKLLQQLKAVDTKIAQLEEKIITQTIAPAALRYRLTDSVQNKYDFEFKILSKDSRIDAFWKGTIVLDSLSPDTLQTLLQSGSGEYSLQVVYQNKRIFLQNEQGKEFVRFYRYKTLSLVHNTTVQALPGSFALPKPILEHPEVQAWLTGTVESAKATRDSLQRQQDEQAQDILNRKEQELKKRIEEYRGKVIEIPGGRFQYRRKSVTMSPFAMHQYEVSQLHYERIMLENKSVYRGAYKPVQNVTFDKAKEFCKQIGGALPTEAQWEYAARAGAKDGKAWLATDTTVALDDYAVYANNSLKQGKQSTLYGPQNVGSKKPNAWELYDMSGNVSEWTNDKWSFFGFFVNSQDPKGARLGHYRIFKGGNWKDDAELMDATEQDREDPRYWGEKLGFRCAFPARQVISGDSVVAFLAAKDSLRVKKKFTGFLEEMKYVTDSVPTAVQDTPAQPAQPTKPKEPATPAGADTTGSAKPVQPVTTGAPQQPVVPKADSTTQIPPATPATPPAAIPATPVAPVAPVTPVAPVAPIPNQPAPQPIDTTKVITPAQP